MVQPATASLGDMFESWYGWESVPESIAKAKREKVGREAIRPDKRGTTVVVDGRLGIRINVPSDDHMETSFITNTGLRRYEIVEEPFSDLFGGEGCKVGAVGTADPISSNNPNRRSIGQVEVGSNGSTRQIICNI